MHGFLGRLADVLARQLLSWLHRRVEPGSREWLDALTAESECADDGWQRLRWALGGMSLVWTINQHRQKNEPTRSTMRALIVPGVANIAATLGVVLAAIMRETPWTETDHGPSFLSRHRITVHLIAGTISFAMADALIRMRDRHLVADNVNHYAVLGSAMFAAILAGLIRRHGSRLSAKGTIVRL